MNNSTVSISFRVDKNLKVDADELFKQLGLSTGTALTMFLTQCIREQRIPFSITMNTPFNKIEKKEEVIDNLEDI